MSKPPHGADVGECDKRGLERRLHYRDTPHGEGAFCNECLHLEPEEDEEEDGEPIPLGFCPRCGAAWYTTEGHCGRCQL